MPYIGGKFYLAKWIISEFPENYQEMTYVEPFGGAGWVLFKKEPSNIEVWNDINSELFNMFKQIIDNYDEFKRIAMWMLRSRELFNYIKKNYNNEINPVKKAVYFAYLMTNSFSGRAKCFVGKKKNNWFAFLKKLRQIYWRFSKVIIENLDYKECIQKYDSPDTLFYIDPPYLFEDARYHYKIFQNSKFTLDDHLELANILKSLKGKFLLSYYPHEVIEKEYKDFRFLSRNVSAWASSVPLEGKRIKKTEILIKNF